jgi:hypothetical protein
MIPPLPHTRLLSFPEMGGSPDQAEHLLDWIQSKETKRFRVSFMSSAGCLVELFPV